MYVIEITYGEYDDYTHIPIMVVESQDEAILICEAIEQLDETYLKYARDKIEWLNFEAVEFGTQITELPLVVI